MLPSRTSLLIAIATGVALEVGVALATGRREAWDASIYWTTGIPLALLMAALLGYLSAGRGWLSTILIAPAQVAAMMYRSGSAGSLWPLMLVLSAFLSLPFVLVAFGAKRFRARW